MTETAATESKEVKADVSKARGRRRELDGVVISAKQQKTVRVEVQYLVKHPRYNKYQRMRTRMQAHDEKSEAGVGDKVRIAECRPISKSKTWRVIQVLEKAKA